MAYTEVVKKNGKRYYYRSLSKRNKKGVAKERVYLGVDLSDDELKEKENNADRELGLLDTLLTKEDTELLEKIKNTFSKQPKATYENRYESFISQFTQVFRHCCW